MMKRTHVWWHGPATTATSPRAHDSRSVDHRTGLDQVLTCDKTYGYLCPRCGQFREGFTRTSAARKAYLEHAETCDGTMP